MSGTRYLREWTAAVQRTANSTPDLFAGEHRKQFLVLGIRRTLRKSGVNGDRIDLETLNETQLETVRVAVATQLRRQKQQREKASSDQNL